MAPKSKHVANRLITSARRRRNPIAIKAAQNAPKPACGWSALGGWDPFQCDTMPARKWRRFAKVRDPEIGGTAGPTTGARALPAA
jgi:hypothetical protein